MLKLSIARPKPPETATASVVGTAAGSLPKEPQEIAPVRSDDNPSGARPAADPRRSIYGAHFGLSSEPFSLTPDPSFLYLSPGHAEALAALEIGLQERRGLLMMTGEVGTGKTTLLYSLLSELSGDIRTAYVSNTRLGVDDILRQALTDFGAPSNSSEKVELLAALNSFLRDCAARGSTAALVIDEAQNLDDDAFENIRLLSNFETFATKLLQIVLVGQPELEQRLARASVRQIAERIAVRCRIEPLSREECLRYIQHRLEHAGSSLEIFTPAALDVVIRRSRGLPRRINILCHNALLFAYGRGQLQVTRDVVEAAAREREIGFRRGNILTRLSSRSKRALPRPTAVLAIVALAALLLGLAFWNLSSSRRSVGTPPVGETGLSLELSVQRPQAPSRRVPETALAIENSYRARSGAEDQRR